MIRFFPQRRYIKRTDAPKYYPRLAAWLMFAVASPLLAGFLGRGPLATVVAVIGWLFFVVMPVLYPVLSIRYGFIRTRRSELSTTYRDEEPIRFWVGLVTLEALWLCFALLATFALRVYLGI